MADSRPKIIVVADDARELVQCLSHLFEVTHGTHIEVLAHADAEAIQWVSGRLPVPEGLTFHVTTCEGPWLQAVQAGLAMDPDAATAVVMACSARPPAGWLDAPWPVDAPGVAAIGPVSEHTTSPDQHLELTADQAAAGVEAYAAERARVFGTGASSAGVLDPWFVYLTKPGIFWMRTLALDASPAWVMAHFAVTLRDAGLRSVAAEGCYVGRAVPASPRPRQPGDLAGRLALYRRHARQAARAADTVGAVIRARVSTLRDLGRLRACVAHAAQVVDGIAIVLGNHPLDMQDDPASMAALKAGVGGDLSSYDAEMLRACSDGDAAQVARAVGNWGYHVARLAGTDTPVRCKVYEGQVPDAPTEYALGEAALHDLLRSRIGSIGSTLQWILALQYDELIEPEATRAVLHRLTTHPNPLVCAYDVAEITHWETTRLCREDPPWGDGGKWTGGPSRVALYRAGCGPDRPGFGLASQRVANLRLRRLSWMTDADRARMKATRASEGMRMAEYRTETRLGLHMLVYERENPEDVARWLDEAHGLVDVVVLVWTGDPANVPSELKEIVEFHDARLLFVRLDHDLAAVRNAGIDELARAGLRWAWFVDPDEWWPDPLGDARAMRRACESTRWGWLQNVANYSADGSPPTISDSIRMSRIDPSRPMRMSGRVHEGFGDFLDAMVRAGEHPRVIYFPFVLQHRGMALGETRTREKLDHYERLLRLELQDRPHNPGAWVSLAWHYDNDGHPDLAAECLSRAVACAGRSYLPHKEQGMRYLRLARDEFLACVKNLSTSHAYTAHAERILAWLQEQAPPPVRRTPSHQSSSPAELPAFPPLVGYDDTRGAP